MFHRLISVSFAILFLTATLSGCATQQPAAPAQATAKVSAEQAFEPFHDIVNMAFVAKHVSIPMAENVMLIDARPYKPKYIKGHIPGAISIPDSQFDKMTDKLPADKDSLLIFYCGGLKCKLSHKSAMKAEKLGYTNVTTAKVASSAGVSRGAMLHHFPSKTELIQAAVEYLHSRLLEDYTARVASIPVD